MAETLTDPTLHGKSPEATQQVDAQVENRGIRAGLREAGKDVYSLLDLSAGMALTSSEIRFNRDRMDVLNNRYNGMLERQTGSDTVSVALEADLILDYRRDAQRAGYTNVDAMPAELREQIVENAVRGRADEIIAELEGHHPDWTREQLAEAAALRISDIITLLSMSAEQRDGYRRALFSYRDRQGDIAALETELEEVRQERRERLGKIGGVAVRAVMGVVNAVRSAPANAGARATVAGMTLRQKVGEWFQRRSPEGKKATIITAASVAVAGIATYIGMRYAAGYESGSGSSSHMALAANNTDLNTEPFTGKAPKISNEMFGQMPPAKPEGAFTGRSPAITDSFGSAPSAEPFTGKAPKVEGMFGGPEATHVSPELFGGDLSGAKTSEELFTTKGLIKYWPDTIKVSAWDPQTKDGSLWGIGKEMLQHSGVKNPTDAQIDTLVDALRPQAGPDGQLLEGQKLNLRPAVDLLPHLS